jgi:hypothetical protein
MTTLWADLISLAQPQQRAMPCARWKLQRRISKPLLSPCGRVEHGAQQAQRPRTACRSLEGGQVTANLRNRHPVANRLDFGIRTVRISDSNNLNLSTFYSGADAVVCHAHTGGAGGCLNLEKCLHVVSPFDASNIAHDALNNNTVCRIVFGADMAEGALP